MDAQPLPDKIGPISPIVKTRSQPQWVAECSCGWWVAHSVKINTERRVRLHFNQSHSVTAPAPLTPGEPK